MHTMLYAMRRTPQQNGVVEMQNHTIIDMVRYMVSNCTLTSSVWMYALRTVAY